jgi:hypothetical protein
MGATKLGPATLIISIIIKSNNTHRNDKKWYNSVYGSLTLANVMR